MSSIVPDLELPILVVDDAHWQKVSSTGEEGEEYSIFGRDGFRLSTKGYEFTIPSGVDFIAPNIIQLVIGKDQLYATAYEPDCTLTPPTWFLCMAQGASPVFRKDRS